MSELIATLAQSTLSAAITDPAATTLAIASPASGQDFPATGNFRIKIDNELLLVTGRSSLTFTVTRGIEGTTAATHANSSSVIQVLTAAGLAQYVAEQQLTKTSGATALGSSFDLHTTTDFPAYNDVTAMTLSLPSSGDYLLFFQGSAVLQAVAGNSLVECSLRVGSTALAFTTIFHSAILSQETAPLVITGFKYTAVGATTVKLSARTYALDSGSILEAGTTISFVRIG